MPIQSNLLTIQKLITDYERKYGREPGSVQLLGASKGQSVHKIADAFAAGLSCFGENYLQEAQTKMSALSDKQIEWHFIGSIQTNKTRKIAELFSWVQSVDDIHIAKRLNEQRPPQLPPLNICIEVNISHEATKRGIDIALLMPLVEQCLSLPHLKLRGLMAIPAPQENATLDAKRQAFRTLYTVWQSLREQGIPLDTLSMGMSGDFEAAIAEGSTMIRIGTAIFGSR